MSVTLSKVPGWEGWTIRANWRADGTIGSVTISAPPGTEVDPARLREVPWRAALATETDETPFVALFALEMPQRRTPATAEQFDRGLVDLYRIALQHGLDPREAIRVRLGAHARTVAGWLASLRRRGLLRPYHVERAEHAAPRVAVRPGRKGSTDPLPHSRYIARDFRAVRDDPDRTEPVREALAKRWGKKPPTVDRWLRVARQEGYLTDDDKITPGRPRKNTAKKEN